MEISQVPTLETPVFPTWVIQNEEEEEKEEEEMMEEDEEVVKESKKKKNMKRKRETKKQQKGKKKIVEEEPELMSEEMEDSEEDPVAKKAIRDIEKEVDEDESESIEEEGESEENGNEEEVTMEDVARRKYATKIKDTQPQTNLQSQQEITPPSPPKSPTPTLQHHHQNRLLMQMHQMHLHRKIQITPYPKQQLHHTNPHHHIRNYQPPQKNHHQNPSKRTNQKNNSHHQKYHQLPLLKSKAQHPLLNQPLFFLTLFLRNCRLLRKPPVKRKQKHLLRRSKREIPNRRRLMHLPKNWEDTVKLVLEELAAKKREELGNTQKIFKQDAEVV